MSTFTHESMINHHQSEHFQPGRRDPPRLAAALPATAASWPSWSDRDLHDVGLSWSDIAYEAEKPFWRA